MDTRNKIISVDQALALTGRLGESRAHFSIVLGYFDVLQPGMLVALDNFAACGTTLFGIVLSDRKCLLSNRTRAELAAALRVIDYVIPFEEDPSDLVRSLAPAVCLDQRDAHGLSTGNLIAHVFQRHGLEQKGGSLH